MSELRVRAGVAPSSRELGCMPIELFEATDRARLREAFAIRTRVFVDEQGVPADEEIDAYDEPGALAVHALVREDDVPIAAGRFYAIDGETVRIGRMAVDAAARGRGAGRAMLDALVAEARRRGYRRAHLHAQNHARGFYAKAGFFDDGEPLVDANIEHQPMSARLEDYGSG